MKLLHQWRHTPNCKLGASATSSRNDAAARGIAYHRRVYRKLEALLAPDPETKLLVEPWFTRVDDEPTRTMRQPDAVVLYPHEAAAVVVEVKMNWKDERDEMLISEYLPIVKTAFELDVVWPLMIVGCLRGGDKRPGALPPLLGLKQFEHCLSWEPGRPTPILLLP